MNRNLNVPERPQFYGAPQQAHPYKPQRFMVRHPDTNRDMPTRHPSDYRGRPIRPPEEHGAVSRRHPYEHQGAPVRQPDEFWGRPFRHSEEQPGVSRPSQPMPEYPGVSRPSRPVVQYGQDDLPVSHVETQFSGFPPPRSDHRMSQARSRPSEASESSHLSVQKFPPEPQPTQRDIYHNDSFQFNEVRPDREISGHRNVRRNLHTVPRGHFDSHIIYDHANKIVAKMEEDESLMQDTPVSEQLRKDALRDMPQSLTVKRFVKMKLKKSVSQKSQRRPIGFFTHLKYRLSFSFAKFNNGWNNFNYFELWHGTLKYIEGQFGSGYASYFKFLRWLLMMNFLVSVLCFTFLVVPQIVFDAVGSNGTLKNYESFKFGDIFVGAGSFMETVLYYSHYTNKTIELVSHFSFDMPAAYFSLNVVLYLISFLVLGVSTAQAYRRNFIETQGGAHRFASKLLCGWDFGIATKEAATLKKSSIYNELKELLSEATEEEDRSWTSLLWIYLIYTAVNLLIIVVFAAVCWGCWLLLDNYSSKGNDSVVTTAAIISIAVMVLPVILTVMSKFEEYENPRTSLYVSLTRTYLLGCVIIGAILAFWLTKADSGNIDCWENNFAAEIYRFIMFDFVFSVILAAVIEIAVYLVRRMFMKDPKHEFDIAKHTLEIIYNQALFWVGLFYSPILPIIVTLKMLIIWYINELCVRFLCKPPTKTWRAAQTQTWFMLLTFVSILLIIAVHGYSLTSIPTSKCGPLQDYQYVYQILTQHVASLEEDHPFWKVVMYITKPGAVALIIMGLCVLVYYLKEQAYAQKEKVDMLREMLVWMAKDKKFLVHYSAKLSEGKLHPFSRDTRYTDPALILPGQYDDFNGGNEFASPFKKLD